MHFVFLLINKLLSELLQPVETQSVYCSPSRTLLKYDIGACSEEVLKYIVITFGGFESFMCICTFIMWPNLSNLTLKR